MKKRIAILGATSHIAKSLIDNYSRNSNNLLFLFARSVDKVKSFIKILPQCNAIFYDYSEFIRHDYDIIINCVGAGTPEKVQELNRDIFSLTKTFDDLVVKYLETHRDTRYFYFSSGIVHLVHLKKYLIPEEPFMMDINNVPFSDYYSLAKIFAEKRHRSLPHLHIIDLRVFAYFSRYIDLQSSFLITSIINSILHNKTFITNQKDIVRDYIHPDDLFSFIECFSDSGPQNAAIDVYSKKPVTKFELLDYFKNEYHLDFSVSDDLCILNPTGEKDQFFPFSHEAGKVGYVPLYSSLEGIAKETHKLMNQTEFKINQGYGTH